MVLEPRKVLAMIKLNIGCGPDLKKDWINIDSAAIIVTGKQYRDWETGFPVTKFPSHEVSPFPSHDTRVACGEV